MKNPAKAIFVIYLLAGLIPNQILAASSVADFKNKINILAARKGPFYFNNFIDGSDRRRPGLGSGCGGNVWFGWHRLAAYDNAVKDLFLSLAYDLTNGGPNMPLSQNKTMENAPLCFYAWAARLLAPDGKPQEFP